MCISATVAVVATVASSVTAAATAAVATTIGVLSGTVALTVGSVLTTIATISTIASVGLTIAGAITGDKGLMDAAFWTGIGAAVTGAASGVVSGIAEAGMSSAMSSTAGQTIGSQVGNAITPELASAGTNAATQGVGTSLNSIGSLGSAGNAALNSTIPSSFSGLSGAGNAVASAGSQLLPGVQNAAGSLMTPQSAFTADFGAMPLDSVGKAASTPTSGADSSTILSNLQQNGIGQNAGFLDNAQQRGIGQGLDFSTSATSSPTSSVNSGRSLFDTGASMIGDGFKAVSGFVNDNKALVDMGLKGLSSVQQGANEREKAQIEANNKLKMMQATSWGSANPGPVTNSPVIIGRKADGTPIYQSLAPTIFNSGFGNQYANLFATN